MFKVSNKDTRTTPSGNLSKINNWGWGDGDDYSVL